MKFIARLQHHETLDEIYVEIEADSDPDAQELLEKKGYLDIYAIISVNQINAIIRS